MEYLDATMRIFGYITGSAAAIAVIYKLYKWFRKPSADNSAKLEEHDKAIEELQKRADKNYKAIDEIKDMQSLLVRSMIELLDNRITGNNIDGLKQIKKEMLDYLTD